MSTPTDLYIDPSDVIPVGLVPKDAEYKHLDFSPGQWDWLLRQRRNNGLASATMKIGGKRLYLSRSRFRIWLASRIEVA
jgi:hypothetical protein